MVPSVDGRTRRGDRTRAAVLDTAVAFATEVGLEGISLGQLADRLGVSKSGFFAHWRSKEDLQLATVERARERFAERVVRPALCTPRGLPRLWAIHEYRLADIANDGLPGGCFFANAQFEYDARPGVIRDRIAAALDEWLTLVERLVREAVEAGHLDESIDLGQLTFEIDALQSAAVYSSRLFPAQAALSYARTAVLVRLRALTTRPDLLPED